MIIHKVKAKIYVQYDSIVLLESHSDMNKLQLIWEKICSQVPPGEEPEEVKFLKLDHNACFFDQDGSCLKDRVNQTSGVFSLLLAVRGVTKRVDDGKYKLIIRVKQVKMEEKIQDNMICEL